MITLVNEYSAVLDSCVLLPIKLCDLLLRLAEEPALYSPKWSRQILQEVEKNLQKEKFRIPKAKVDYRIACMTTAFPEAMISGYESIIDAMPNHEKDRHVLACAVVSKADCIVTANLKHFPEDQISQFGIEALHPDEFLINQWTLAETTVRNVLMDQARSLNQDILAHIEVLAKSIPQFVSVVRSSF